MINNFIDMYNDCYYIYYSQNLQMNDFILYDTDENNHMIAYLGCKYYDKVTVINQLKVLDNDLYITNKLLETVRKFIQKKNLIIFVNKFDTSLTEYFNIFTFDETTVDFNIDYDKNNKIAMIQKI